MKQMDSFDLREIGRRAAERAEKELILKTLLETSWNHKKAAQLLEVSYKTFTRKVKRYRLESVGMLLGS